MNSITKVPREARWSVFYLLAALAMLISAQQAHAFPGIGGDFNTAYPGSNSEANAGCQLCHGNSTSTWNEYGWGLRQNGQNFAALEGLPSININGGTTMLDEINASTQPGWTTGNNNNLYDDTGLIANNALAPGGIGDLDPAAADVPPVANDDSATTNQDTAVTIDVVANDTDADGDLDPTSVAVTGGPANGTVVNNGDGTVTYTPNAGFFSPPDDTFTYTVGDDAGNTSNEATVTVTVNQVIPNQPPVANDDTATTNQDTAVTIDVVANDTDVNGDLDPTTVAVTGGPANGTVVNNGDGTVTYTPNAGFFSPPDDSFTYTVGDDAGNTSNEATVTVTVNEVIPNQPPVANDDTATTNQDTAVPIDVVANDTDVNGDLDPTSVAVTGTPANGAVVNNGDGTVTYTPNAGFFSPPADTFTYTVDDLAGNTSNEATVTVTVNEVVTPACSGINDLVAEWRTQGNGQLRVSGTGIRDGIFILSNAFDPNQIIDSRNGNNGKVNFNVSGRNLNPVPCRVEVNQPDVQICGQADVINAPADCAPTAPLEPLTARGDLYATPVGNPITVTASRLSGVLYNDFGGVAPLSAQLVTSPTRGTLSFDADGFGGFTYTPGADMVDNEIDEFTYVAVDANGNTSDPATVVLQTLSKQVDFKMFMNYELGMHCTGFEFAYCCVLPPYNSIVAQVIKPAQGDPTSTGNFVDGFPRLLEGDPNAGLDGLNRETVVRDWDYETGEFKKYQLRYYHDAQPRQEGNTSKPNITTLIDEVEGNSLQYFNTVFDSAQPDANNALVYGPYNGYNNVIQGSGVIGDAPTDNYANAWLNHFYIYVNPETGAPNLEGKGNTGLEGDKIRLGVAGQVAYPPNSGAALQPMGPSGNGAFENLLTFSTDTGTVVYTQAKVLEDLPIMLTSPRIWEGLGLPLTPFEDTIGFFADPGAVDEDAVRPYVAMKAALIDFDTQQPVMGSNGQPVIGFGTAPIDIPNCERCHSAPSVDPDTGLPNVNSPNYNRPDYSYPHGGPLAGLGLEDMTNLEYNFWLAYYDIVPGVDSDWYPRLKGAAINMLTLHDYDVGTSFTANYAGVECVNNPDPTDPNSDPDSYACSFNNGLADLTDQSNIPQNTRLGNESVICQRCHADNVIANVRSATFDAGGQFPIPPITEAIHNQHRNASEGGVIVFNDSLGRDGGCQGCHPAHRSDGVMDEYPITLGGNNVNADGDNRLNPGGCFVGRDVHSNPMKDVDGAETPSYLTAVGEWLDTNVADVNGEDRGIWCTNCHSQLSQEIWRTEDCNDLIRGDCLVNPRGEPTLADVAAAVGWTEQQAIDSLDPKVDGFDRTEDLTHAKWNPANQDANVATIEVDAGGNPVVTTDADGDISVNILSFCTTDDCVSLINGNKDDQTQWRYPAFAFIDPVNNSGAAVPFSAATDGRDHWLAPGEPHCADCHQAPFTEQSGNVTPFPPFNYPAKASLMRYTRGHQDVTCQGCHESIHGLYPVTPTIDTTSYAQAAALNNDGSHGPLKCASCHTHVDGNQIPTWVDQLTYNDPNTPGQDNIPVAGDFDVAIKWMHTYTAEANPNEDVCQNCHGDESEGISVNEEEYLEHAMTNRVSRVAMDAAERAVNGGQVFGEAPGAQRGQLCSTCHDGTNLLPAVSCNTAWNNHLIQGRVSQTVWEDISAPLGGCGW